MNKDHYLLSEVARAVSKTVPCKPYQLSYLLTTGVIEEPKLRINNKRIFTAKDVDRIRGIFQRRIANGKIKGCPAKEAHE
jgi:DNA-binding transcriptional MerR regulator